MTMRRASLWAVIAAAAATGTLGGWASASPPVGGAGAPPAPARPDPSPGLPPSPLIFPAQSIPLRFDHKQHLALGARCDTCHVTAATSTSVGDNLIPAEAACRACHEIDRAQPAKAVAPGAPAARCDACHLVESGGAPVGWMPRGATFSEPPRVRLARPNLKFNHRLHAARGMGCELCHAGVSMEGMATRDDLPRMSLCLGCHDGKQATSRCGACHLTEPDGRLKTNLASAATAALGATGKLVPSGVLRGMDAHGPTFGRDHTQAGKDERYCLTCHKRTECIDCHGGTVRPFDIHPSDYVSLHGVDARRNTPDCSSCHRSQTFCVGCHQRSGVSADPEGGQRGRQPLNPFGTGTQVKRFHPPGWVQGDGAATGASSGHATQARRNIRSCASCHREQSCLDCHSTDPTRGLGVSPHGPMFGATARCRTLSSKNRRACLKCHALGAPELDCEMP